MPLLQVCSHVKNKTHHNGSNLNSAMFSLWRPPQKNKTKQKQSAELFISAMQKKNTTSKQYYICNNQTYKVQKYSEVLHTVLRGTYEYGKLVASALHEINFTVSLLKTRQHSNSSATMKWSRVRHTVQNLRLTILKFPARKKKDMQQKECGQDVYCECEHYKIAAEGRLSTIKCILSAVEQDCVLWALWNVYCQQLSRIGTVCCGQDKMCTVSSSTGLCVVSTIKCILSAAGQDCMLWALWNVYCQ